MFKKITASLGALVLVMFGCLANAADTSMTGKWNVIVQLPVGTGSPVFDVVQDGNKLTGTYKGALGESPVSGTIEGNAFKLTFTVSGIEAEYAGTLSGNEITGTATLKGLGEGTFKGTRAQ